LVHAPTTGYTRELCGFPRRYVVQLSRFTVLVGPNNGGKTTLLRAIQFALDAFRIFFGEGHEPNLNQCDQNWQVDLPMLSYRLGVQDLNQLFYGRSRQMGAKVILGFQHPDGDLSLEVSCNPGQNNIVIRVSHKGQVIAPERNPQIEALVTYLYRIQARLIP